MNRRSTWGRLLDAVVVLVVAAVRIGAVENGPEKDCLGVAHHEIQTVEKHIRWSVVAVPAH